MKIKTLIRNIKQLSKINLKQINKEIDRCAREVDGYKNTVNTMINHLLYETSEAKYFFIRPHIFGFQETLDKLCQSNSSFIRFGDGEAAIMNNEAIRFQKADATLAIRLRQLLNSQKEDIMVGIDYHLYYPNFNNTNDFIRMFYRINYNILMQKFNTFLNFNKQYYTTAVTSVYEIFNFWAFDEWYSKWRSIWNGKKITIICGDRVFKNIKFNIFDNAADINYFYVPSCDAWDNYNDILNKAKKIDKDRMIIIIAGPTAKPLAYDLAVEQKRRCLDLGHLAKDYDAYKKSAPTTTETLDKFFAPD